MRRILTRVLVFLYEAHAEACKEIDARRYVDETNYTSMARKLARGEVLDGITREEVRRMQRYAIKHLRVDEWNRVVDRLKEVA